VNRPRASPSRTQCRWITGQIGEATAMAECTRKMGFSSDGAAVVPGGQLGPGTASDASRHEPSRRRSRQDRAMAPVAVFGHENAKRQSLPGPRKTSMAAGDRSLILAGLVEISKEEFACMHEIRAWNPNHPRLEAPTNV